jgi:hypothetical protein
MDVQIVGLVGFAGAGKDSVANTLVENYGYVRDSFASPLKDATSAIFGWSRELLEGDTAESREFRETPDMFWSNKLGIPDLTPRKALQILGTDVIRDNFHENIWMSSIEYRIRTQHMNSGKKIVITDARFPNELKLIHNLGGKIVRVSRGSDPTWFNIAELANLGNEVASATMRKEYEKIHVSEWSWVGSHIDHIIENSGTLTDLEGQVSSMMAQQMEVI